MPGLLRGAPLDDAERSRNDRNAPLVVLAVLAMLAVYLYLFTQVAASLGLPLPEDLAERLGVRIEHVFDDDRNVDSNISVQLTSRIGNDDERLILFVVVALAFLSAYFAPLRYKLGTLTFFTALVLWLLYGSPATAGLLFAHLSVFLVLHPGRSRPLWLAGLAGLLLYFAVLHDYRGEPHLTSAAALTLGAPALYRFVVLPLLGLPRVAPILRTAVVQSALLVTLGSAIAEGLGGDEWALPLGLLLFFWQWERLMMYHIDYKDGLIPDDISLGKYLAVFFNPGVVPNWNWGVTIGQGYAYVHGAFLAEDKNRIVLSGLKLWAIALLYLLFWNVARHALVDAFTAAGIPVYRAYTREMVVQFTRGVDVSTASVLATTMLDLIRWTMLWAGVMHFKVGLWRVCGFRVDPYIHRPWAATNLATLWSRFTYHYREFLVRAFYYPVFFRFFRTRPYVRIFVAIMAAAAFGNLVWGHIPERLYYRGMEWENVTYVLGTWPYFLLLGGGIAVAHTYLRWKKRRRKPWTPDRWLITDVLAVYVTLQYYALVHIFARPAPDSSNWDLLRLFLRGFGLQV